MKNTKNLGKFPKKNSLQKNLKEIEKSIYPKYEEFVRRIPALTGAPSRNSKILTSVLDEQKEIWHKEIEHMAKKLQSDIDETESTYQAMLDELDEQESDIIRKMSEISYSMVDLRKITNSNDVCIMLESKSKLHCPWILRFQFWDELRQQLVDLSELAMVEEEDIDTVEFFKIAPLLQSGLD